MKILEISPLIIFIFVVYETSFAQPVKLWETDGIFKSPESDAYGFE